MGIFVDFSKAFDLIDHRILLTKLERYGLRGIPLQLLESYLLDRKQSVVISNAYSSYATCSCGVPQGSILGPFLFLIYINDLPRYINEYCVLYADDTNIFVQEHYITNLFAKANKVLKKFCLGSLQPTRS